MANLLTLNKRGVAFLRNELSVPAMAQLTKAQSDFLELLVTRQALKFGDFTLKSGRKSPYFINTGCFFHGSDLQKLGQAYAATIAARFGRDIDIIFGPAYKGIPLALAAAQAYEQLVGHSVGWAFDRKEAKDHGDGGQFVGAPLKPGAKTVIVDDVLTAGTALRESLAKLRATGVGIRGAVVSVDRQEKGTGEKLALQELSEESGVDVCAIIAIGDAVEYLASHDVAGTRYLSSADHDRIAAHVKTAQR